MATVWKSVGVDPSKQEQLTSQLADDGTVTVTVQQTWVAQTAGTSGQVEGTIVEALTASGGGGSIPALGGYIELSGTLFQVTNVRPERIGPYSFTVQLQAVWKYTPPNTNNNSDKYNVSVQFSGQDYTQDAYQDKDHKPIVNSAGQPFDPTLKHTYNDEKISISYNTTTEQSMAFASVRGKVNSGSVTLNVPGISRSFNARTIRCDDAEQAGDVPLQNGSPTWKVSLNFTVRADGFVDHVIDQGYAELDDDSGELVTIKDKYGDPVNAPVLLDGSGHQLDDVTNPHFLDFKIEQEADFSSAFAGLGA